MPPRHGGNAILEMALVLPLLIVLAMGMVEFGQYFYLKQAFERPPGTGAGWPMPGDDPAGRGGGDHATLAHGRDVQPPGSKYYAVSRRAGNP